jgi:hypothetical protein
MTELEVLVGNLNRLTELLRLAWSDIANPLLTPFERREACNQIDQVQRRIAAPLLLMGAELGLKDKR